jgi:hypothetical protein
MHTGGTALAWCADGGRHRARFEDLPRDILATALCSDHDALSYVATYTPIAKPDVPDCGRDAA